MDVFSMPPPCGFVHPDNVFIDDEDDAAGRAQPKRAKAGVSFLSRFAVSAPALLAVAEEEDVLSGLQDAGPNMFAGAAEPSMYASPVEPIELMVEDGAAAAADIANAAHIIPFFNKLLEVFC